MTTTPFFLSAPFLIMAALAIVVIAVGIFIITKDK